MPAAKKKVFALTVGVVLATTLFVAVPAAEAVVFCLCPNYIFTCANSVVHPVYGVCVFFACICGPPPVCVYLCG